MYSIVLVTGLTELTEVTVWQEPRTNNQGPSTILASYLHVGLSTEERTMVMKKIMMFLLLLGALGASVLGCRDLAERFPRASGRPDLAYRQFAALFDNRVYLPGW